jgi:hypothetical protein
VTVAECDKLPDVPVTVTVKLPVEAVLLAARVSVLVPVVLTGAKKAFTPLGKPDALKLTLPVKPFCGATAIMLPPLDPCVRLRLAGVAVRLKFGTAFTVRETMAVFVRVPEVPEVPEMVTVAAPSVAVLLAESVRVLVVAVLPGLKVAVTPDGMPDADNVTFPVKAPIGTTVMILAPFVPCTSVKLLGDAVRLKPAMGATPGQLFTRLVAFTLPMPVAKSQPEVVPYAGANEVLEVESTPAAPEGK